MLDLGFDAAWEADYVEKHDYLRFQREAYVMLRLDKDCTHILRTYHSG